MRNRKSGNAFTIGIAAVALVVTNSGARTFTEMFSDLIGFSLSSYSITTGSTASGTATISLPRGSQVVRFASSNPEIVSVPAWKAVSSAGVATFSFTGTAAGCATITASFNGRNWKDDIVVHPASHGASFTMTVPEGNLGFPIYNQASLTARLLGPTSAPIKWTLTSSDRSVATVPATVTQTSMTTPFKIKGNTEGCAIITATSGIQSVSKTVHVIYIGN